MLLGKRPRPPIMRRTRSMSGGMSLDMHHTTDHPSNLEAHHEELLISDSHHHHHQGTHAGLTVPDHTKTVSVGVGSTLIFPSTTNSNNHNPLQTAHVIHSTPHFLRTCGLCNCRLAPARDIYMYRGDTAFCSLECREQQMKQDRRKEKWKVPVSNKLEDHRVSPPYTATVKAPTKSQTAACT